MTGQEQFGSYEDSGAVMAVNLVNELTLEHAFGRQVPPNEPFSAIRRVLEIDPASAAQLRDRDRPGFITLAAQLREVFRDLHRGDIDAAASRLNELLAAHPAHPHLAKDDGRWRVHHHPVDAGLVPMAAAVSAEAMARMIGAGDGNRLGTCDSDDCDRVFLDASKNGSRRFCSTTCQNRVKAAAFRRRQATSDV
ncbi:MAG: CGNR zinc finger domain-containing protein [Acidimicrobiales bacterium]